MKTYYIAYEMANGEFDIVDYFEADSNKQAEAIAEEYPGEWYLLDSKGKNVFA